MRPKTVAEKLDELHAELEKQDGRIKAALDKKNDSDLRDASWQLAKAMDATRIAIDWLNRSGRTDI